CCQNAVSFRLKLSLSISTISSTIHPVRTIEEENLDYDRRDDIMNCDTNYYEPEKLALLVVLTDQY
ncbi:hypothetical protein HN51_040590, partial [Arachis hypogaea]